MYNLDCLFKFFYIMAYYRRFMVSRSRRKKNHIGFDLYIKNKDIHQLIECDLGLDEVKYLHDKFGELILEIENDE